MSLSLRDRLHDSLRKDDKNSKKSAGHSKAYHRHFEGYVEVSLPKSNGKGNRIERIYTGNYYRQDLVFRKRILIRIVFIVLFLFVAVLYVSSAIQPLIINSTWFVVLPQAGSLVFLVWIMIAFVFYLTVQQDMTIEDYRNSSRSLLKATFGSSISLGMAALATLVFIILNHSSGETLSVLVCSGKYFVGGLISLSMNLIERKVKYIIIPNQNKPPIDSFEIS
jgi:hypothetical protein